MSAIYLDNAATTCVSEACADTALKVMTEVWYNPSSRHSGGLDAQDIFSRSAETVAAAIGASSSEIIFTSGGTEANNLAVLGAARAKKRTCRRVITTAIEHPSVLESAAHLEAEGFEVVYLNPDRFGHIDIADLAAALTEDTALVSMMLVNNELGTILPVKQVREVLTKANSRALFHCDAVQAFGKLPFRVKELGCDLLTVSGHKIHAPKGVGALYCRKGVRLEPLMFGGSQQESIRPGTEALPAIAAFARAVRDCVPVKQAVREHYSALCKRAREGLSGIDKLVFNSPDDALECILNFSTCRVMSETMVSHLSSKGIYVSGGSACKKGRKSHVISALGMDRTASDSAIRISFCETTTEQDIDVLVAEVRSAVEKLVNIK